MKTARETAGPFLFTAAPRCYFDPPCPVLPPVVSVAPAGFAGLSERVFDAGAVVIPAGRVVVPLPAPALGVGAAVLPAAGLAPAPDGFLSALVLGCTCWVWLAPPAPLPPVPPLAWAIATVQLPATKAAANIVESTFMIFSLDVRTPLSASQPNGQGYRRVPSVRGAGSYRLSYQRGQRFADHRCGARLCLPNATTCPHRRNNSPATCPASP